VNGAMAGVEEQMAEALPPVPQEYSILKQRVDLDVDFARRAVKGSTEITIQPLVKDLRVIRLHCRQSRLTSIQAGGITAKHEYEDPYRRMRMPGLTTVHQHEMLRSKIKNSLQPAPQAELTVTLPSKLKIQELHIDPATALPQYNGIPSLQRQETDALAVVETMTLQAASQQLGPQFAPFKLFVEFEVDHFRDGLHWIGCEDGDRRYPYVYSKVEPWPVNTSCIFPCVDDATSRCSWEFSIRCPRTLGDAFRKAKPDSPLPDGHAEAFHPEDVEMVNGTKSTTKIASAESRHAPEYLIDLSEDEASLDLTVVSVGEQSDDVIDSEDETKHTVTFILNDPVTARHIGFAIGPFEQVDLSTTRDPEEEERLGQSAVKVNGYCLPGRAHEVRNTCYPITKVIDSFGVSYGSFPFPSYQILFIDDFVHDAVAIAGLSFCNAHLLFPEDIIEPLEKNTRIIIRTVADQWMGVNVIAKEPTDAWAVAGIAGFMTDLYGKILFGNNAYRWQQKLASEKVYELDVDRPSISQLGHLVHLDPSIREFLDLKSPVVLFILDRRLMKASGSSGVGRIINRIFLNAKTGALVNGELSTADLQRICEKFGHNKLESFFRQWIFGAGCPIFYITQRFNKKKLVVEMTIMQRQLERRTKPPFAPSNFVREIKEHVQGVWANEVQPVFTGPMTIRIHEADGTPYEHIVEIKEQTTRLEIPYNTKYKRLKRSRRQKERAAASGENGGTGEDGADSLLYCLGDILDTPEEIKEWNLADWTAEDEEKMGQESYEWIRMDADFEWIGKMHLVMPLYMYISQLQQDRDLVAQYDSMRYLLNSNAHHVSLTILLRTLMDRRYFHGIRSMAADGLAILASNQGLANKDSSIVNIGQYHLQKAFQEMFCFPSEIMPKPNDWSDRTNYLIQCAIPRAMARLRDGEGKVPISVRKFFVDKLKFNDNSTNDFSDCHYVATLMSCLADALAASHREPQPSYTFSFGGEDDPMETENPDADFEKEAIDEIERYRRIDEWITTYHNIYSITALDCLQKLTKAGLVKDKTKEVLQYTRATNADLVRLEAFKCLNEMGLTRRMPMMKYLLHSAVDEPSPFLRNRLAVCFGEALGHIAFGDDEPENPDTQAAHAVDGDIDGQLVVEQEVSNEARQLEATRKTTPEGAIVALKAALGSEVVFKAALWYATTSPSLSVDEVSDFCDIAALLYDPIASLNVAVKLPRSYRCARVSKAKVRFVPHGPYRVVPWKALSTEDWQEMQEKGLRYTGPVSSDVNGKKSFGNDEEAVRRRQSLEEDAMSLKDRFAKKQSAEQRVVMPPPPTAPTLTAEKSGFKLTLGNKRKNSVDVGARAGSPKALKVSKQHTPNGHPVKPEPKRSPSVASQRRGSTPGSKLSFTKPRARRLVKLHLSGARKERVLQILAQPAQPGGIRSLSPPSHDHRQASRSITPVVPQQSPSSLFPSGTLQSPTGNNYFSASTTQAIPLNLGGFRSYGPTPDADVAAPEVKRESLDTAVSPVNGSSVSTQSKPLSASSPVDPSSSMPPPPKKKLTLKLVHKASNGGAA